MARVNGLRGWGSAKGTALRADWFRVFEDFPARPGWAKVCRAYGAGAIWYSSRRVGSLTSSRGNNRSDSFGRRDAVARVNGLRGGAHLRSAQCKKERPPWRRAGALRRIVFFFGEFSQPFRAGLRCVAPTALSDASVGADECDHEFRSARCRSHLFWPRRGASKRTNAARLKGGRYEDRGVHTAMMAKAVASIFADSPALRLPPGWGTRRGLIPSLRILAESYCFVTGI